MLYIYTLVLITVNRQYKIQLQILELEHNFTSRSLKKKANIHYIGGVTVIVNQSICHFKTDKLIQLSNEVTIKYITKHNNHFLNSVLLVLYH